MTIKNAGAVIAVALLATAVSPLAQAQGANAAQNQLTGAAIPGMCLVYQDTVVLGSTVGKAVTERLNQLGQQVQAELNSQATSLQTDEKAFEAQRASLTTDQLQSQGGALAKRQQDLSSLYQQRQQEMQQTAGNARQYVASQAGPILQTVSHEHHCSIVLLGSAVAGVAPSMDLTPEVVSGLNAKITTYQFDRIHLDQQQGGAAPAGQ